VAEPSDRSQPASPRPRRSPRFVLPDDHHDERTAARIEAFLDGPSASSRRHRLAIDDRDRPRRPHELDTRPDWTTALRRESSRHARYGRPASVLLIELDTSRGGDALDRVAREIGDLIRSEARETDRAVRAGAASFRVLLPETSARSARHVVARLDRAVKRAGTDRLEPAKLRIEIVAPSRGGSLEEALFEAERRLAS
jgi:diguanylate cyclase (GGDEF)-like protein